jgi:hypothetical protein
MRTRPIIRRRFLREICVFTVNVLSDLRERLQTAGSTNEIRILHRPHRARSQVVGKSRSGYDKCGYDKPFDREVFRRTAALHENRLHSSPPVHSY